MKIQLITLITIIYLVSCTDNSNKTGNLKINNPDTNTIAYHDSLSEENNNSEENSHELNYVISVANGYNYDSLRTIALETSMLLGIKFDTLNRYFNPTKKKIVLPDNDEHELWAGEYLFRRTDEDFVSIEMQSAYIDTLTAKLKIESDIFYADTLKMFVFASMNTDNKYADSLLKIIKQNFKNATIIPTEIYTGCMD